MTAESRHRWSLTSRMVKTGGLYRVVYHKCKYTHAYQKEPKDARAQWNLSAGLAIATFQEGTISDESEYHT